MAAKMAAGWGSRSSDWSISRKDVTAAGRRRRGWCAQKHSADVRRKEGRKTGSRQVSHSLDAIALLNTRRPSIPSIPSILSHIWADGSQELGNCRVSLSSTLLLPISLVSSSRRVQEQQSAWPSLVSFVVDPKEGATRAITAVCPTVTLELRPAQRERALLCCSPCPPVCVYHASPGRLSVSLSLFSFGPPHNDC